MRYWSKEVIYIENGNKRRHMYKKVTIDKLISTQCKLSSYVSDEYYIKHYRKGNSIALSNLDIGKYIFGTCGDTYQEPEPFSEADVNPNSIVFTKYEFRMRKRYSLFTAFRKQRPSRYCV